MKKQNNFTAKLLSLLVAVMLVGSQNVFAVNHIEVTGNYTTNQPAYNGYSVTDDGGVFYVHNYGILNVQPNVVFSTNSARYGGAIETNNKNASVNIANGTQFLYNYADYGGAIDIEGSTVTIGNNVIFSYNYTYDKYHGTLGGDGGAIFNNGNLIIGDGGTFGYNHVDSSTSEGGAIRNASSLTIGKYVGFYNNKSTNYIGGAISNDGTVNIDDYSEFCNNSSKTYGGAITNNGNFTIGDSYLEANSSENGGAIYNVKNFKIKNEAEVKGEGEFRSLFIYNTATKKGGAIYNDTTSADFIIGNDTVFGGNNAQESGGAIYNYNGNFTIGSALFDSNSSIVGGAIYNHTDESVENSFAIGNGSAFVENSATESGGAIYNNGKFTIGNNVLFQDNYAENKYGGAIYNVNGTMTIGSNVTFEGNDAKDGGAMFTNLAIVTLNSNEKFLNNKATNDGGAIYNHGETFIGKDSSFEGNVAKNSGGAIYNNYAETVIGSNTELKNNGAMYGGAIYNKDVVTIENEVVFANNVAEKGGAIYNEAGRINIGDKVKFTGNSVTGSSSTKDYNGGAIYVNAGTVNIGNKAEFTNNSAAGYGGAIYNTGGTVNIGDDAKFTRNESPSGSGVIYGDGSNAVINIGNNATFAENSNKTCGAIVLSKGTVNIGDNALFEKNKSLNNFGGAIISMSGKVTIGKNATFIGNDSQKYAGAISNNGTGVVTIKDGAKFIGNTANGANQCIGGAIGNYVGGTINLIANTNNVEFTGNKHGVGTEKEESNAICTQGQGAVNLWAGGASIIFNDKIKSEDNLSTLNINKKIADYQESNGTGKIILNEDMSGYTGTVNFYGGTIELGKNGTLFGSNNGIKNIDVDNATIKMANGKVANAQFGRSGSVNIRKELNLTVDADLENKVMDMPLFVGWSIDGKLNVKEINIIKDSDKTTRVDFAELRGENKVITVDKARSVLYSYDAKLDYGTVEFDIDGNHYSEDGYYYTFTKNGFNPVTAAGAVSASVGGYATQSVVTGQAFASMDRQMAVKNQPTVSPKTSTKQGQKPSTKGKTEQKSSVKDSKTTTNNPKDKKDDIKKKKKAQSMGLLYASAGDQVFEETSKIERGAWLRPFILNETVKVGDTDVDNNLYGTLAGIDLPVKGDILASFYLGYAGSKQKAEEVKSNQTGYVLGATGMLIKEKWYAGLTANVIFNKASVDTDDGTNDIDMNMYSIGAKAGYNYDMGKNWILEPNITLMYGIVNCGSYETTLTKVDSQSVNNILLEPQVKARWQLTNGWQPYGLLGYAANLSSKPTVKTDAGDLDLDSIGGYVEFGAGVNKDFVNTAWSCYAQLTGRAAGRSGFEGNLGIKYKF